MPSTIFILKALSMHKSFGLTAHTVPTQDGIFKMGLSPDGSLLAAIHFSGKLSIWAIPSLKQQGVWRQDEQVRLLVEPLVRL